MTDDLDPIFDEQVARMSAQLDKLTDTEVSVSDKDYVEVPGPLAGYRKEPFFDPCRALTGQDLGLIQALYGVVQDVWMHADEHAEGFQSGMGQVLSSWRGTAATQCATYVGELVGFVNAEQRCRFTFAQGLATYAAIIKAARLSLDKLMDACVNGWDQATRAGGLGAMSVGVTALASLTGVGFGAVAGTVTLPTFMSAVTGILGTATNVEVNLEGKHADIANSYLKASTDLVAEAAEAISANAMHYLDEARDGLPKLPALPAGVTDQGAFHPEHERPAGLTSGRVATRNVPAAPTSKIQNTLG